MSLKDPRDMPPNAGETKDDYCRRLEVAGHDELFLRRALAQHFRFPKAHMAAYFSQFPTARLRHIEVLRKLHPARSTASLTKKLAANLGLTAKEAAQWVQTYNDALGLDLRTTIKATHTNPTKLQ